MEIDFTTPRGSTTSVLLLGDNGTGKSSIADALEFCLRGKVSRRGKAGAKIRYESRNLMTGGNPSVQVAFNDNQHFNRGALPPDFAGTNLGRTDFAPGFALAPVVISRADIDVFWQVDSSDRMRFFFDYLRDSVQHSGYAALELERAQERLQATRADVLAAQIALAGVTGKPVGEIPVNDRAAFYEWRGRNYSQYGSDSAHPFRRSSPRRMRSISSVPSDIRTALSNMARELEAAHKLSTTIQGALGRTDVARQVPTIIAEDLPALLEEISNEVSAEFSTIANVPHVAQVRLLPASSGYELDVTCLLESGEEVEPTQILSEGALDLLALLILLGVQQACASRGQTRFMVLDDVWQSIDAIHREAILQYLFSERFEKWQMMITVHDRLWARLIEERARKQNFPFRSLQLIDWTPQAGPRVRFASFDTAAQLASLIDTAPPEALAAYTGRALEELSDRLSVSIGTNVTRKVGDRYTLEDMWSGVYAKLSKADWNPELKASAEKANSIYDLRNIYGSHFAEWAQSLSDSEVRDFARAVVALWTFSRCITCGEFVGRRRLSDKGISWQCDHAADV